MSAAVARLRSDEDVRHVLRRGRRAAGRLLVVHAVRRDDDGPGRATAVASKKVGNAVVRNRAKRLLREAVRAVDVHPGVDVAVVARAAIVGARFADVLADLETLTVDGQLGVPVRAAAGAR